MEEYEAIRLELQLFNPELSEKPFVVAYNKMDTQEAADQWPSFQEALEKKGVKAFSMSAATQQGTDPVVWAAFELLQTQKAASSLQGINQSSCHSTNRLLLPFSRYEVCKDWVLFLSLDDLQETRFLTRQYK